MQVKWKNFYQSFKIIHDDPCCAITFLPKIVPSSNNFYDHFPQIKSQHYSKRWIFCGIYLSADISGTHIRWICSFFHVKNAILWTRMNVIIKSFWERNNIRKVSAIHHMDRREKVSSFEKLWFFTFFHVLLGLHRIYKGKLG